MAGAAIVDCGSFYYKPFYYAPVGGNLLTKTWACGVSGGLGRRKVCRDLRQKGIHQIETYQKEMYNKKTYNKKIYNTEVI